MVSSLFYYQLALFVLVWLFVMLHVTWAKPGLPTPPVPAKSKRRRSNAPKAFEGLTKKPHCALCERSTAPLTLPSPVSPEPMPPTNRRPRTVDTSISIIKFFALDRLLPWVVAVSTDSARDSALPHPSSLGQSASYRNAIVRGLLRLVRLNLSSIPMGLERAPMAWRRPCFLQNLHPLSALSWPPWTMRFARISHTAACPPYSRSGWPFVSRPFW